MFDEVINSNEYALNPDFSMLTRKSTEFGKESILRCLMRMSCQR